MSTLLQDLAAECRSAADDLMCDNDNDNPCTDRGGDWNDEDDCNPCCIRRRLWAAVARTGAAT